MRLSEQTKNKNLKEISNFQCKCLFSTIGAEACTAKAAATTACKHSDIAWATGSSRVD